MRVKNKGRRETRRHYRKDGTMREGWKMRIKERIREILKEGENGGRKEERKGANGRKTRKEERKLQDIRKKENCQGRDIKKGTMKKGKN